MGQKDSRPADGTAAGFVRCMCDDEGSQGSLDEDSSFLETGSKLSFSSHDDDDDDDDDKLFIQ